MSTTYKTIGGEALQDIARRVYGTASSTAKLRAANPGLLEPLAAGLTIRTPEAPNSRTSGAFGLSINFDGTTLAGYTSGRITRTLDSIDSLELSLPYDPNNSAQRAAFAPFRYAPLVAEYNGALLFDGVAVDISPETSAAGRKLTVGAYARAGVLADCSSVPKSYKGKDLRYIAQDICEPFGVPVTFSASTGGAFGEYAYEGGDFWGFLVDTAKQRGLWVRSTPTGGLEFFKPATTGAVAAELIDGQPPAVSVSGAFASRGYYSDVTGATRSEPGRVGRKDTRKTGLDVYRPVFIDLNDIKPAELPTALDAAVSRMRAERASYTVNVASWQNRDGNLWEPGQFVTLQSDAWFLPDAVEFSVRSVELNFNESASDATLQLVDAGVYK